jgi:hypothetical protein
MQGCVSCMQLPKAIFYLEDNDHGGYYKLWSAFLVCKVLSHELFYLIFRTIQWGRLARITGVVTCFLVSGKARVDFGQQSPFTLINRPPQTFFFFFFNLWDLILKCNHLRGRESCEMRLYLMYVAEFVWLSLTAPPGLFHLVLLLSLDRTMLTQSSCSPGRTWTRRPYSVMPEKQQTSPPSNSCPLWILPSITMGSPMWPCLTLLVCTPLRMLPWYGSITDTSY